MWKYGLLDEEEIDELSVLPQWYGGTALLYGFYSVPQSSP